MPDLSESAALVALLRSGRHPWQAYADMLEEAGSARTLLELPVPPSLQAAQTRLFDPPARPRTPDLEAAAQSVAGWEANGMRIVTVLDPEYPANLLGVHDRPPFIFVAGELAEHDRRAVAIIGSRQASRHGLQAARSIAEHLSASDYTVVSGLAAGIDTAAHEAALSGGGRTIAVIGTGLAHCYPASNAHLQRRIAQLGAVVSQFWPDVPPSRETFPRRNAVMSGISLGSVIVEASMRSGARIQARLALAHGRPVFLLEKLLSQEWARKLAERPGVHVVRHAEEITATIERLTADSALTD